MSESLIHKYLDGLMDQQESIQFETQLKSDPTLASEFALLKDMRQYVSQKDQTESASKLIKELGQEFNPALKTKTISIKKKSNWRYYLPLAAAAVLVLGLFIRPLFNSSSLHHIDYEASPLSFQERSQESNELLQLSAEAFNNENYKLAIGHLDALILSNVEVNKARLYKSIALLNTGQHDEARAELKQLENVDMFDNASYYYRGLSHLDTGDASEANRYFNLISANSSYYKRAEERIKQLSETNIKNSQ